MLDKLCMKFPEREIRPDRVDRYIELRHRLGLFQRKLDAIDDEAMKLYAEIDEEEDRRLVGLIE